MSVPTLTTFDSISNIEDHNNKNDVDDNETIININSNDNDNGGWDFIQALENEAKKETETHYIHPLDKRYSSKLSEKSLELCTEILSCETGSHIGEHSDVYSNSSSDSKDGKSLARDRHCGGNLPPPLTSSGSNCIQVSHREDGRLVIKNVNVVPSSHSYFKAERRDGRLRLHFANNYDANQAFKYEQQPQPQEQEVEEEKQEVEAVNEKY